MTTDNKRRFPIMDDIPESEIEAFQHWLRGETVPVNDDGSQAYYPYQYTRFKAGQEPLD